jgi:hypothetical protein
MINTIYIPTFKRVNDQVALNFLPDKYKQMVTLVVQEQEIEEHTELYGHMVARIMEVGNDIGIAKTRELICRDAGKQRFYMLDDDITFYRRNRKYYGDFNKKSNMDRSKRLSTEDDLDEMFELFDKWLDEPDLINVGHRRQFYPPSRNSYSDLTIVHSAGVVDGEKLSTFIDDVKWTLVEFCEDVNFNFEYMTRGYRNRVSDEFPVNMPHYQEGGVNVLRDAENFKYNHDKLMNEYSDYMKRKDKSVVRENIGEITEYRYNWKKAYKEQIKNKTEDGVKI